MTIDRIKGCNQLAMSKSESELKRSMYQYSIMFIDTHIVICRIKMHRWIVPPLLYSFYTGNFMTLASFFSWVDQFESYLVENPEDRFSRDKA